MEQEVGFNEEYQGLMLRYAALREQSANQIEQYSQMVHVVGPNLKNAYMLEVGQFENQVFELDIVVRRWKRRFALRQAALNQGEQPDLVAIEQQLDKEFEEFKKLLMQHIEEMKKASLWSQAKSLTKEETVEIRSAYLAAVKKLHPDLNPNLSESAKELWHQIHEAYSAHDLGQLKFLCSLVESVSTGAKTFEKSVSGMETIKKAIAHLEAKCKELHDKMELLKTTVPFIYEDLLRDEAALKEKQAELAAQIENLKKTIAEYERMWNDGL